MTKGPAWLHGEAFTLALHAQVNRLAHLDADALVGHNISAFDLDILLHRLEKHRVRGRAGALCASTNLLHGDSQLQTGLRQHEESTSYLLPSHVQWRHARVSSVQHNLPDAVLTRSTAPLLHG